jgi:hypothetical protein
MLPERCSSNGRVVSLTEIRNAAGAEKSGRVPELSSLLCVPRDDFEHRRVFEEAPDSASDEVLDAVSDLAVSLAFGAPSVA